MPLDKLIIRSYTDRTLQVVDTAHQFELPINPESYTQNFKVEYDTRRGHGASGTQPRFKSTAPEELRLEFVFDGTDTVQGYKHEGIAVKDQIDAFLTTVYDFVGTVHRPRFLAVNWGQLVFPCILTNLDINYTLFDESGEPIRAKLNATFLNYQAHEARARRDRRSSPDLTHRRLIQPGERLDLMTYKIYDSPKYVLQVADANELTSIRNIRPLIGREIQFPPLDKTESATQ
ncbi:MAG: hypothetical protein JNL02_05930 [Saprospiraceae bacterium]|nr:hypothetical protein [Saprospiraceae bacterium]